MIVKLREGSFTALISAVSHLVRVGELELPAVAGPGDELLAALVGEELQQELPQLDGARALVAGQQRGGDHGLPAHTLNTHGVTIELSIFRAEFTISGGGNLFKLLCIIDIVSSIKTFKNVKVQVGIFILQGKDIVYVNCECTLIH